jgi:hypothetical protein
MVRAPGIVPCNTGLGINRTSRLGGDIVESSYIGRLQHLAGTEALWTETVGVESAIDCRWPLATSRSLIDDEHLPLRTDRGVAVVAESVRARNALRGSKGSYLTEARHPAPLAWILPSNPVHEIQTLPPPVAIEGWSPLTS